MVPSRGRLTACAAQQPKLCGGSRVSCQRRQCAACATWLAALPPPHSPLCPLHVCRVWNARFSRRPAAIFYAPSTAAVAAAVRCSAAAGVPISPRGASHHWAGLAVVEGGLVVDLTAMHRVCGMAPSAAPWVVVASGGGCGGCLPCTTKLPSAAAGGTGSPLPTPSSHCPSSRRCRSVSMPGRAWCTFRVVYRAESWPLRCSPRTHAAPPSPVPTTQARRSGARCCLVGAVACGLLQALTCRLHLAACVP